MPGSIIKDYLAIDAETHFDKLAQVFRHDFILYAGMLLSWVSLFEGEIMAQAEIPDAFATATADLLQSVQNLLDSAQPHLHPTLPQQSTLPLEAAEIWDLHYNDFVIYVRPHLARLEPQIKAYVARPEFDTIIQQSLGVAADNAAIDRLLFNTYDKLLRLLNADQFDQRIAGLLAEK